MSHPNGYTQEMIKELLGTAWLDKDNMPETGNQMRRRKGNEMREGKRPYPKWPSAESRAAQPDRFDKDGKYIYPDNTGFNYVQWLKDHPDSTEASSYGNKVS